MSATATSAHRLQRFDHLLHVDNLALIRFISADHAGAAAVISSASTTESTLSADTGLSKNRGSSKRRRGAGGRRQSERYARRAPTWQR